MIHYITAYFHNAFKPLEKYCKLKITQSAGGWLGVLVCKQTDKVYRINVEEIKQEVKIIPKKDITIDTLLKDGGWEDGR